MAKARIRYNFNFIRGLLTDPETGRVVLAAARQMDAKATAQGSQTKVDYQAGGSRVRAAVIAGYENGATAENTRRVLLNSLDAGEVSKE